IAGAANFEIVERKLEPTAQTVELLKRPQPSFGIRCDDFFSGNKQISVSVTIRAAHPAAQLIELCKAKLIGAIDDDGIGVGKIEPGFDNRGANQNLGFVLEKIDHDFL